MWQSTIIVAILISSTWGYDYYIAEFNGPAFGTVEFHPVREGGIQISTNVRGDTTTFAHMLHVHEAVIAPGSDCNAAGSHTGSWSVDDPNYLCVPDTPAQCHVGDISGKHGPVNLRTNFEQIDYAIDYNLFLSNLTGRSLVLHATELSKERFACANLIGKMYPEYLSATFTDVYYGAMIFRTRSDGNLGIIHRIQTHLGETVGHEYHVHEDPVEVNVNGTNCYAAGDHFDPTNAEIGTLYKDSGSCQQPAESAVNDVSCFYGDLVGKHGPLALEKPSILSDSVSERSVRDTQLVVSEIWKRSVVIHQSGGELERILCDTLEPQEFTEAQAVFSGDVLGTMTFKMHHDGTMRITYNLRRSDNTESNNHKIHVHVDNILDGDCLTGGGHYDPMGVEDLNYDCDPSDVATCYFGDLSGKFGQAKLPTDPGTWRDEQLTVNEIIGRSIVIHVSDGKPRLACATITPTGALPELAVAEFFDPSGINGFVMFRKQSNEDIAVFASLQDASGSTPQQKIVVTEYPTYEDNCFTSGPIYDPDTNAHPALGSLTDRLHLQVGEQAYETERNSKFRVPGVIGRSLVVKEGNQNTACTTISQNPEITYAEAGFLSNSIWGTVRFRTMGDETMISYNLMHADGRSARDMQWYIHPDYDESCDLRHPWDPFQIGSSAMCNRNAFATCMVGDFSSKHGDLTFPAKDWKFDGSFTVTDVLGMSVVITDENGNPQECAPIIPKRYESNTASAEFLRGIVIFRQASSSASSVVFSLIGENQTPSDVFIKDTCADLMVDPFATGVQRPSMFVQSTDMKVSELVGKFMTIDGECVEITEVLENSDIFNLDAVAPFDGSVTGSLELTLVNSTDAVGFNLKIDLANADGSISKRHKFHVHTLPVVESAGCASAGGHFDPLDVEDLDDLASYKCDPNSPISTCYYGDFSGRYAIQLPLPIEATLFDGDIPLSEFVGRSIVIHDKNGVSGRYDCATIFPVPRTLTKTPTMEPTRNGGTRTPTSLPTVSTTPFPSRSPVTQIPTMPISSTSTTDSEAGGVNAAVTTDGEGGSKTGLILGIVLPLIFCLLCIPIAYYAYIWHTERDLDDSLKTKAPSCDFECPAFECPTWCPSLCKKSSENSAFHLGRYTGPNDNYVEPEISNMRTTSAHRCPHGLMTFVVDEENWYCSSCQKQMILGDTMMGCRICNVDQCTQCHEKSITALPPSFSTPPSIPIVPNTLVAKRESRLSMPPSRDNSREPSPVRETLHKGLPQPSPKLPPTMPSMEKRTASKASTSSYASTASALMQDGEISLPTGFVKSHTQSHGWKANSRKPQAPPKLSTAPAAPPSNIPTPPVFPGSKSSPPSVPPALPKIPSGPSVRPPSLPSMIPPKLSSANPAQFTVLKKPTLDAVNNVESEYTLPSGPSMAPPDFPIPSRTFASLSNEVE